MSVLKRFISGIENRLISNQAHRRKYLNKTSTFLYPFIGLFAFVWFLIRVIPKPSRALYPCQRAAFPMAAGFIIWILGVVTSSWLYKRARNHLINVQILKAIGFFSISLSLFLIVTSIFPNNNGYGSKVLSLFIPDDPVPVLINKRISETMIYPEAVVGLMQSEKEDVTEIGFEEIDQMIRLAVDYAGGLDSIIEDGNIVILKPNLVAIQTWTESREFLTPGANGVVTDFRVIQSVVNIVRELNPNGQIILLEGSAGGFTKENMDKMDWNNVTGLDQTICLEEESGAWQEIDADELVKVSLPENTALYTEAENTYYMNKVYYEADVIISLPCLKNHYVADITGGVKNVAIGVSPANIYGPNETEYNIGNFDRSVSGIDHGYLNYRAPLHYWIHDYYMCRPVDFVIMDGLQGLQNGPLAHASLQNGSENLTDDQMNMRLILASNDAIALDAIEALIMGVDPHLVRYLTYLHNNKAGCADPDRIRIEGNTYISKVKKAFENGEDGAKAQYMDFEPPACWIRSYEIIDNILRLNLGTSDDAEKVEFSVNGKLLDPIVLGDFENISITLPDNDISENDIEIIVSDHYLNQNRRTLTVTGYTELKLKNDHIKIYPNPVSDYLIIQFMDNSFSKGVVEIFDFSGMLVYHQNYFNEIGQDRKFIDLRHIPDGPYIIKFVEGSEIYTYKFFKK